MNLIYKIRTGYKIHVLCKTLAKVTTKEDFVKGVDTIANTLQQLPSDKKEKFIDTCNKIVKDFKKKGKANEII